MSEEILTIEEIRSQYDGEWVLIESPETDESQQVKSGKIRFHSKERDEVHRMAAELHLEYFALLYIGAIPKDVEFVL